MGTFFVYILKSSVCLAAFYLFYRLLLSRETFHRFNRMALLSLLVLSCVVPLIEVSTAEPTTPLIVLEESLLAVAVDDTETDHQAFLWREALVLVYLLGIAFFLVRNVWSLIRMWMLIRKCSIRKDADGIYIATHNRNIAPFSWMRFIVLSEKDLEENGHAILTHERAHIRARHSVDLLVADVCIFFQWFNPAAWLLKRELQAIHEYEADESVISNGVNAKTYQLLLIEKAVGTRLYSMANSFNHSSLKKRITMMLRKKSNPWARAKYLYVLPVVAISVAAFARPEISEVSDEISAVKVNDLSAIVKAEEVKSSEIVEMPAPKAVGAETTAVQTPAAEPVAAPQKDDTPVFDVVEQMPEFPGGMGELVKFLSENVKYPKTAFENNVQGRVIAQFVVASDGTVGNAKILKSVSPELDAEALRVIALMPKWKPGMQNGKAVNVKFAVPVMFKLSSDKKNEKVSDGDKSGITAVSHSSVKKSDASTSEKKTVVVKSTPNTNALVSIDNNGESSVNVNPLIIVDGKEMSNEEFAKIDSKQIESVTVLKDESARAKYGEKGKNCEGIIVVKLKKK